MTPRAAASVRSLGERLYGALLWLLPRHFRRRYGEEMRDFLHDALREARASGGSLGSLAVWWHAIPDLLHTAAYEHLALLIRPAHLPPHPHTDRMSTLLLSDARFALRAFRRHPVFFGVAMLVLALGTGAVSTIFSVANAVVLRPVPGVRDASHVVEVGRTRPSGEGSLTASYPYFDYLRGRSRSLEGVAAWGMTLVNVGTGGQGISGLGNAVSGNYFAVLGVQPALGRFFAGSDDRALSRDPVVVVSHAFWQRHLGGDSTVIGRALRLNGRTFTVLGVAPARFSGVYPALRTDVWIPLDFRTQLRGNPSTLDDAGASWMQLVGRLAPAHSVAQAREELSALTAQYVAANGAAEANRTNEYSAADVDPIAGVPAGVASSFTSFFAVLLVIASLVLMIASMNVASMLLSRAAARRREMAMRMALGAARRRLVRQLLVETLLLFAIGGGVGIVVAFWGTQLLQQLPLPESIPPLNLNFTPDLRVLAVTIGASLLTGLVFGLSPAYQGTRTDVQAAMRSDSAGAGRRRSRLRDGLIVAQIAMSLLLLSSAGLFVRALGKGRAVDPGFSVDNVLVATVDVESAGYDDTRARAFFRALRDRLAAIPVMKNVGAGRLLPLSMSNSGIDIALASYAPPNGRAGDAFGVNSNTVDAGYFDALRLPILQGRNFNDRDDEHAPQVAIVNETFARRFFPQGSAIGQTFRRDSLMVTIVGVTRDSKFLSLDESAAPFVYLPFAQQWRSATTFLLHYDGPAEAVSAALLREMATLDPSLPPPRVSSLRESTAIVLLPQRVAAGVSGALGLIGLLLAAVGLYGLLSFSTTQRTREIGVRIALGASRGGIVRMVLGEGLRLVGFGMMAGFALALFATRALRPFLFGLDPMDPITFGAIGVILLGVAVIATVIPAARAAGIDPSWSMREE